MSPLALDILIAAGSLALFGGTFAIALLATRPPRATPLAPTPDLGAESPAVVNLLGNGWQLNEDAVEATLLDLAARRHFELRQPGSDPRQTTVHLRDPADAQPAELTRYERRVLDRVRGLAVGGVVPISALTFRDADQEKGWEKRFRSDVIADARARGLCRRRFDAPVFTLLEIVAGIAAAGIAAAVAHWESWSDQPDDDRGMWIGAGVLAFVLLSGVVSGVGGQRHTSEGLAAAGRWLGVRAWLRGHEQFADLPPASVMVWDRYLAYGAALGVTHTTSEILDLGMADRKLVWSSYGGGWHRVRVRYPRRSTRYGLTGGRVLSGGLRRVAVGIGLLLLRSELLPRVDIGDLIVPGAAPAIDVVDTALLVVAIALLARGGYWLIRGAIDLATTRTVTGEVLWIDPWLSRRRGNNGPMVTSLYYLAVDDGSSDKTTAWGLPRELNSGVATGDTVAIRVRPWTRRVLELQRVAQGGGSRLAEALAEEERAASPLVSTGVPGLDATRLLIAAEVGQALGMPVRAASVQPAAGVSVATYTGGDGSPVLLIQVAAGTSGRWIWRIRARGGSPLPGLGDKARIDSGHITVRSGERTLLLMLVGAGMRAQHALPTLAQLALSRLPEWQNVRPESPRAR